MAMSLLTPTPCSPQGSVSSAPLEHGYLAEGRLLVSGEKALGDSPSRSSAPYPLSLPASGADPENMPLEKSRGLAPLP